MGTKVNQERLKEKKKVREMTSKEKGIERLSFVT